MPDALFSEITPEFSEVLRRANEFDVSATSCLIRTMQESRRAVAAISTIQGRMAWCCSSEEMAFSGLHNQTIRKGSPPPRSKTFELLPGLKFLPVAPISATTPLPASDWFNAHRRVADWDLYEEVLPIAKYDSLLTILIHEE